MSTTTQNSDNKEIDLAQVSSRIGSFFEGISLQLFRVLLFMKRNRIWIGILFITGALSGYYLDKISKNYNNEIIVSPNFGSVDYLYAKVELINAKIEEGDTVFLRDVVKIKQSKKLKRINVVPITDVYKFIENKNQNFELIKLMAEDGDVKKIVNESLTSKNYPFHLITFNTTMIGKNTDFLQPLLTYLNDSEYYRVIQKEYLNNIKVKMQENDSIIAQIDGFLNGFSQKINESSQNDKLVYYNENTQLNDVIKTKDGLIAEQGYHRLELANYDYIIKSTSETLNIKNTKAINGKMKYVVPFLLVSGFLIWSYFRFYFRKQMSKLAA